MRLPDPPLLLVTDRRQAVRPLNDIVAAALAAGCRWVSLREKDLPAAEQIALAQALLPLARRYGARLTLHGDAALAQTAGVDGVHLGAGGDAAAARARLGAGALIGLSIHAATDAARLDPRRLDYCVAGPVFATASKPGHGPALGVAGIAAIVGATAVPVVCIGGIAPCQVGGLAEAGARGIAVMGAVMRAKDTGMVVTALRDALAAARRVDENGR